MSSKNRLQMMGNLQIILLLTVVTVGGWRLHRVWGALFSALVFLGTLFWASQYTFTMYDLESRLDAFGALMTFMFKINLPHMIIGEGRVLKKSSRKMSKTGGPGVLTIKNDSAVVTESGTRAKAYGPGAHLIISGREVVKEAVDLRPQVRAGTVKAMTKDGVDIEIRFFVGFQISSGGREPTADEPYPFSEQALLRAVYRSKQVDSTGAQPWHERVPDVMFAHVREMIATHYMKDFFAPDQPDINPRIELKERLLESSRNDIEKIGAQVNWVNFETPSIPDEDIRKYFDNWRTKKWDAAVHLRDSQLKADRLQRLANALKKAGLSDETIRAILTQIFAPSSRQAIIRYDRVQKGDLP